MSVILCFTFETFNEISSLISQIFVRLGRKSLPGTNTVTYLFTMSVSKKESYITLTSGGFWKRQDQQK
jgi:hypothetical protein